MPRLASFTHEYDDIELHLVRGLSRSDFARLRVDAAIECSPEAPSDLKAHRLVTEEILAVVTPEHYEEVTASGAVFNKLYMPSRPELWGKWLEGYGPRSEGPTSAIQSLMP